MKMFSSSIVFILLVPCSARLRFLDTYEEKVQVKPIIKKLSLVQAGVPKSEAFITEIHDGESIELESLVGTRLQEPLSLSLLIQFSGPPAADNVEFFFEEERQDLEENAIDSASVDQYFPFEYLEKAGLKRVTIKATKTLPDGSVSTPISATYNFILKLNKFQDNDDEGLCQGSDRCSLESIGLGFGYSLHKMYDEICSVRCIQTSRIDVFFSQGWQCGHCPQS